jgi:hypothetical protein
LVAVAFYKITQHDINLQRSGVNYVWVLGCRRGCTQEQSAFPFENSAHSMDCYVHGSGYGFFCFIGFCGFPSGLPGGQDSEIQRFFCFIVFFVGFRIPTGLPCEQEFEIIAFWVLFCVFLGFSNSYLVGKTLKSMVFCWFDSFY